MPKTTSKAKNCASQAADRLTHTHTYTHTQRDRGATEFLQEVLL